MRILRVLLFAVAILPHGSYAATPWHAVSHTTERQDYYIPQSVTVRAEQATLTTERSNRAVGYGYSGPANLHTRNLRFSCRGADYSVPQAFVEDLLWLHADRPTRASVNGRDIVFTMTGCDGEKGYSVHFHFRAGRFFQRILADSEAQTILIRTNNA